MSTELTHTVTRQAVAAKDRSRPGKVTGRLKRAIDAMIWAGATRKIAAQDSELSDHSLRQALKRPHVLAYYRAEMDVLRTSERARTFHRLTELRDQDVNKQAAVAASRSLEELSEAQASRTGHGAIAPGLSIIVINSPPIASPVLPNPTPRVIDSDVVTVSQQHTRRGPSD